MIQPNTEIIFHTNSASCKVDHTSYLFYPHNSNKERWDIFMTFVLIVSCIFSPLNIAFDWSGLG